MFAKPADTHQFLDPTSSHPYRCSSDNENFDKGCNDLEKWLMKRVYNEKMIFKQILRAREHLRNELLEKEKPQMPEQKLTFNINYYPAFQNFRAIMEELHILVTPNKERKKVFPNVPVSYRASEWQEL